MQQVTPGLGIDARALVRIDGALQALYTHLFGVHVSPITKVRDKCPSAGDTHGKTHCPYTLEAWIITRIY